MHGMQSGCWCIMAIKHTWCLSSVPHAGGTEYKIRHQCLGMSKPTSDICPTMPATPNLPRSRTNGGSLMDCSPSPGACVDAAPSSFLSNDSPFLNEHLNAMLSNCSLPQEPFFTGLGDKLIRAPMNAMLPEHQ
ncbi:hypothetical protein A0H81_06029 [Grifola frondosa]|uniref:Uncharacterized protein n=1 Tax=Grifola frondosa TaxID=5627 RepID=A0A1C7MB33_GRIFR|nr:hypothetical protein A0H81_06029 [Grifola frondosa]